MCLQDSAMEAKSVLPLLTGPERISVFSWVGSGEGGDLSHPGDKILPAIGSLYCHQLACIQRRTFMSLYGFISFLSPSVALPVYRNTFGIKRQETSVGCHFVVRGPAKEITKNMGMPGFILHLETFFRLVWLVFKPFVHYTWFCGVSNWVQGLSHPK